MLLVDLVENATDVHYVVETRNIEAEETFDTKILLDVDRYGESPFIMLRLMIYMILKLF